MATQLLVQSAQLSRRQVQGHLLRFGGTPVDAARQRVGLSVRLCEHICHRC